MAKKNETYNINAMRPALQKAYQNGNRRMISAKDAKEAGVSEGYFEMYRKLVTDLYNAAANYCRVKNSPTATDADRAAALEPIWGCWKALLQCGEKAKDQRDFRPSEHDIANIVSFTQKFIANRNDVSRGQDESFTAQKVWSVTTEGQFRKFVETELGIRIAGVEVMSDEERDFLRAERKILTRWKKAESRIASIEAEKVALKAQMTNVKSAEVKKFFKDELAKKEAEIANLTAKVAEFEQEFKNLHSAGTAEAYAEAKKAEAKAKAEKKAPKAKKADKTEVPATKKAKAKAEKVAA